MIKKNDKKSKIIAAPRSLAASLLGLELRELLLQRLDLPALAVHLALALLLLALERLVGAAHTPAPERHGHGQDGGPKQRRAEEAAAVEAAAEGADANVEVGLPASRLLRSAAASAHAA